MSSRSARAEWAIPAALVALTLVPALGGIVRVSEIAHRAAMTPANARFLEEPAPAVLHIVTAVLYGFGGAFQFSPAFRRRHRTWHRRAGVFLLACAFVVAITGLWMTFFYPWPAADGVAVYLERLLVGSAMLFSLVKALRAIEHREFRIHGEWMIRAYALALGAGTQVLTHLPWFVFVDLTPTKGPRAVMMGAGWVINAVVAEWIIRRTSGPQHAMPSTTLGTP